VTGRETDEAGLNAIGDRVFNLQRAILTREGHVGREADQVNAMFYTVPLKEAFLNPDCLVPGPGGETISKKEAVFDREKFESMKTEYYRLRGWDADTGLQTRNSLYQLGLNDMAGDLEARKVLAL
jgi:aldehyde:ferredoxin oxidoreductase